MVQLSLGVLLAHLLCLRDDFDFTRFQRRSPFFLCLMLHLCFVLHIQLLLDVHLWVVVMEVKVVEDLKLFFIVLVTVQLPQVI